jgi:hypothetical protein
LQELASDCKEAQEFANGCKDLQKPIRICKRLQGLTAGRKEPQGARKTTSTTARVFPQPGRGNISLRNMDSFSFAQDPYFGRPQTFRVATAYKTKANKVRLVDPSETDGSKPRGYMDWFEKSKADDIPSQDPRKYLD